MYKTIGLDTDINVAIELGDGIWKKTRCLLILLRSITIRMIGAIKNEIIL